MTARQPGRAGQPPPATSGVILVLYYARQAPLRASHADHLYATRRYGGRTCLYVNLAVRRIPAWIRRLPIDLVVVHTLLLATRWDTRMHQGVVRKLAAIGALDCPKVALPQDEYIFTDRLCEVLVTAGVKTVLTCAPESEHRKIYGDLADRLTFVRVLPGYLEPSTLDRIDALAAKAGGAARSLDIGYRAYDPEFSLGRHAQLKSQIAHVVAPAARDAGLRTDISLRAEDTLLGDDWYRFLLDCRWVIGVEGGASLLDRDGTYLARSRAFQAAHPEASFDEAEAACFPGADGSIAYVAISPRHLEAAVTGTGQILVEGSYSGILEPGVHYLPVRADFADLEAVLAAARDEGLRQRLVARSHADLVASGRFTYAALVDAILAALGGAGRSTAPSSLGIRLLGAWEAALDGPSWWLVRVGQGIRRAGRRVLTRVGLLQVAQRLRSREAQA